MALLEIVSGPTKPKLHAANENFERGDRVFFVVRSVGTARVFRLYGQPQALDRGTGRLEVVKITLRTADAGFRRLEGQFNYVTRTGELDCQLNDPLVTWLGLYPDVENRLVNHGIMIVSALKTYGEFDLCQRLMDELYGWPARSEYVAKAVRRFVHLRTRLEALGFHTPFPGERMTEQELLAAF